ncbi:MAG TPA: CsiV family protein [Solimonas sp.]|nr:CsiV family protein [Solimonas sp.]
MKIRSFLLRLTPPASRLTLAVSLLLFAATASAESYRVDLILFLDKNGTSEQGRRAGPIDSGAAIETGNVAALARAGITILPDDQFALAEQWQRLRNSKRWQPLVKLAWTQKDPPGERGPALRVKFGQTLSINDAEHSTEFGIAPVEGSVALLLGKYLHLDADLVYTMPTSAGGFVAYRLKERRKMRRDELHHIDSPKLGILVKMSKPAA